MPLGLKSLSRTLHARKERISDGLGLITPEDIGKGLISCKRNLVFKKKSMVLASTYYLLAQCIHDKRMPCRGCIGLRWRLCMYAIRRHTTQLSIHHYCVCVRTCDTHIHTHRLTCTRTYIHTPHPHIDKGFGEVKGVRIIMD